MDGCILCLEIKDDFVGSIKVDSTQWQEYDIKNLIEKHFWPLDALQHSYTCLCTDCWQELFDFHKFYKRIAEANIEFSSINKTDLKSDESQNELKPSIEKITLNEFHYEPEISIKESLHDESLLEEDTIDVKESEQPLVDETPSRKRRKKVSNTNNKNDISSEDPLVKPEKKKSTAIKRKNNKKKVSKQTSVDTTQNDTQLIEEVQIKQDPDCLEIEEKEPTNAGSDTDSDDERDKDSSLPNEDNKTVEKSSQKYSDNDKFLSENLKISCILCQIQTDTFHALCKHFEKEHKLSGYAVCCNKKFYRRSLLVDHVHQHLDPNYFKCNICDKVMADRKCLAFHNRRYHEQKKDAYQCDICSKKYSMYASFQAHKITHLSEEEKQVPCPNCSKKFASTSLLSNHVRYVHLKKYTQICDICGKSIRDKEVFERHMLQHEGKPLPSVSCNVCGLLLANKRGLRQHKLVVHPEGGKLEFTCPICSKISPNIKAQNIHIKYTHKMGYDHKCTVCERAFKTASTLTQHMASHTGTALYTCPWCQKTINSKSNFQRHRKKIHPKEWNEVIRKKYSFNAPVNLSPPSTNDANDCVLTL